jgi:rhodanese-related sulfurtransferase
MRNRVIVLLAVALTMAVAIPAVSKDWPVYPTWSPDLVERHAPATLAPAVKTVATDQAAVMFATEQLLGAMPDDSYVLAPAVARRLAQAGGMLVLDVREGAEFEAEHIAGATNIPLRQLPQALDRLPGNRAAPITVYCANGHRGAVAMTILRLWGYREVYSVTNGINGWRAAGLPLVRR